MSDEARDESMVGLVGRWQVEAEAVQRWLASDEAERLLAEALHDNDHLFTDMPKTLTCHHDNDARAILARLRVLDR